MSGDTLNDLFEAGILLAMVVIVLVGIFLRLATL